MDFFNHHTIEAILADHGWHFDKCCMHFDRSQAVDWAAAEAEGELLDGTFFRYGHEIGDIDDIQHRNVGSMFKDTAAGTQLSFCLDGVTHVDHLPGENW